MKKVILTLTVLVALLACFSIYPVQAMTLGEFMKADTDVQNSAAYALVEKAAEGKNINDEELKQAAMDVKEGLLRLGDPNGTSPSDLKAVYAQNLEQPALGIFIVYSNKYPWLMPGR